MKTIGFKKIFLSILLVFFVNAKIWATNPPHVSHKLATMLLQAVALMGVSYHWGGNTPASGLDCSGFVRYVFKKSLGITLPRTAAEMAKVGTRVDIEDLQPGDLLFFNTRRTRNHYMGISHIGIYLGDNKFIQAPHTGEQIQVTDFAGYWRSHFIIAKRVDNIEDDDDTEIHDEEILADIPDHPLRYAKHHNKYHHGKKAVKSRKPTGTKHIGTKHIAKVSSAVVKGSASAKVPALVKARVGHNSSSVKASSRVKIHKHAVTTTKVVKKTRQLAGSHQALPKKPSRKIHHSR